MCKKIYKRFDKIEQKNNKIKFLNLSIKILFQYLIIFSKKTII